MMQSRKIHRARQSPPAELFRTEPQAPKVSEPDFAEIRAVVLRETLADLSDYRAELVEAAVSRRMVRRNTESMPEYIRFVSQSAPEANELLDEIRPIRNQLFHESAMLDALRTGLYDTLWKQGRPGESFRAWVPCCGTGEEVYSLALILLEMFMQTGLRGLIHVFGTDLDERALETASSGVYEAEKLPDIGAEGRLRLFQKKGPAYQVRREIRDLCVFGRHDVSKDPPFTLMDLVVFRDQLGTLTDAVQNRLLERFHYSLRVGGVLAVGQSETPESLSLLFTAVANKRGIYVRQRAHGPVWCGAESSQPTLTADAALPEPHAVLPAPRRRRVAPTAAGYDSQALLDEQTRALESLRLANEEIVASNEELQVTNEELIAMREELQAANQELATLYQEIQQRNRMLGRESAELRALFRSVDAAVVTLDSDLRVRRFTARAARLFRLEPRDTGRRLTDLQPKLRIHELEDLLRETAENLTSHEREARAEDGGVYRIAIRPLRGEDDRIDGAILTAWPIGTTK